MKKLKKIILAVLCVVCVIALTPNTAKAEQKTYWNTLSKKYIKYCTYDIDNLTPDEFVTQLIYNGLKNDMKGNIVFGSFQVKASSEKDAQKKIASYIKKVKTTKNNKYGLSFGLEPLEPYDMDDFLNYDKNKKVATYGFPHSITDMYYTERLFDLAMKEPYLEVGYRAKDAYVGDKNFYRQKTRSVFKNADAVKKSSDSVKFHFLCSYLENSCKIGTGVPDVAEYELSIKAIYDGKCYGECGDLASLWNRLARLVATDVETRDYSCYRDVSKFNHGATLIRVKNKNGKWDYFEGNNKSCGLFGTAFLKEYRKGVNIYKSKGSGTDYSNIEDWMHYDKKAYVDGYGSFGKSAYSYGKNHKKSELVNLMISKKAKYL